MGYVKTNWVDRAVQYPLTYTSAAGVVGGTITLTPAPGVITQAGTAQNAAAFNNLENGVFNNDAEIWNTKRKLRMGAMV